MCISLLCMMFTGEVHPVLTESDDTATSDIAFPAAQKALEDAGLTAADLDAIICGTVTPDNPFPSMATRLQAMLGR